MFKADAEEALGICKTVLAELLAQSSATSPSGSNLRASVSLFLHNAQTLLMTNQAGQYLENIYRLAQLNNMTVAQMDVLRGLAAAQNATTPGGTLIRDSLILYALATMGLIIAATSFTDREQVEQINAMIVDGFAPMEETIADGIDPMAYQTLLECRAAIYYYLTMTAMPLPQMVAFQFAAPLSTLVAAYRLYTDASRADELLAENHCVHPAFLLPVGVALSK
jgi:prophage DNA circulation protein